MLCLVIPCICISILLCKTFSLILKQEFDDFVDSRFGAEAQAQNAKAAKAMKEIEQLKESLGKGSTSHFESELIPDGFADNLKRETGTYAKRYAGAKII